jgi:hypothetical protein
MWTLVFIFSSIVPLMWPTLKHLLLILVSTIGYKLHIETRFGKILLIQQRFDGNSSLIERNEKSGFVYGYKSSAALSPWKKFYCGMNFEKDNGEYEIAMFCHVDLYEILTSMNKHDNNEENVNYLDISIEQFGRTTDKQPSLRHIKATPNQKLIMDKIKDIYLKEKVAVVGVSGAGGCGKSSLVHLLAAEFGSVASVKYNPTKPGLRLRDFYQAANPEEQMPLIMEWSEIDTVIKAFRKGLKNKSTGHQIEVCTKADFNTLLDDICDRKLYPYIIILMTTNVNYDDIFVLDPTLLRKGRLHTKFDCFGNSPVEYIDPTSAELKDLRVRKAKTSKKTKTKSSKTLKVEA